MEAEYPELGGAPQRPRDEAAFGTGAVVMVCVGYNPSSQRLIRRAYNLARAFGGQMLALHMARPSSAPGYEIMLEENMNLARSLGAEVLIVQGTDLAATIANAARTHRVTHLVMGESARTRWDDWRAGSIMRQVMNITCGIDLYIVADTD